MACVVAPILAHAQATALQVQVDSTDGAYSLGVAGANASVLHAGVGALVNGHWLLSKDYPKHAIAESSVADDLGTAHEWAVTFSGLTDQPNLLYRLRAYGDKPFADIQVFVQNGTAQQVTVESIRSVAAMGNSMLDLAGPPAEDRVLSDSFSEDRPNITIHDLGDDDMYRGVGSQLVYNRQSHESFFAGALTSDRFLTILRIHLDKKNLHKTDRSLRRRRPLEQRRWKPTSGARCTTPSRTMKSSCKHHWRRARNSPQKNCCSAWTLTTTTSWTPMEP